MTLSHLFAPVSVAVIGATDEPRTIGRLVSENVLASTLPGGVFLINRHTPRMFGKACFTSLRQLPEVPYTAVLTDATDAAAAVEECATLGVKALILACDVSDNRELQRIADIAGNAQMRMLGPDALGVIRHPIHLNLSYAAHAPRAGSVAFLSQSASLCSAILDWSHRTSVGFSVIVSAGTMIDLRWSELIDFCADDPATKSILIYMETLADARGFMSAAREAAYAKPIIAIKPGRGCLYRQDRVPAAEEPPTDDEVADAVFARCGVVRVDTIAEVFYLAQALNWQPRPRGPRLAVISNAGAAGALAVDAALASGAAVVEARGKPAKPDGSCSECIGFSDLAGAAGPDQYTATLANALADPATDGVLLIHASQPLSVPNETALAVANAPRNSLKPLLTSWMGGPESGEGSGTLASAGIPCYPFPDTAARVFARMWEYTATQRAIYETPEFDSGSAPDRVAARSIIDVTARDQRLPISGDEARRILRAYCIDVPEGEGQLGPYVELLVCSFSDARYGPVLVFGAGGQTGHLLGDRAVGLPPLNSTLARRLMQHTRVHIALGKRDDLVHLLVRFSQLVTEQPRIATAVLTVAIGEQTLGVVTSRITLFGSHLEDSMLPRPAIRPYPWQYVGTIRLRDGTDVMVRPIRAEDEPMLSHFHHQLSETTVYQRYLSAMKLSRRIAHERLARICFSDYDREMVLVCEKESPPPEVVAVGRLTRTAPGAAEFAVVVADAYQKQGLGTALLRKLLDIGHAEGLETIHGEILQDNLAMQRVCAKLGFTVSAIGAGADVVRAELRLR